jgi:hypothetical protein
MIKGIIVVGEKYEKGEYFLTELVAAGLNPRANPRYLQLFMDGQEQPMRVISRNDNRFDPQGSIEFYGAGLDTLSTDIRVYWLVESSSPGKRITPSFPSPSGRAFPKSEWVNVRSTKLEYSKQGSNVRMIK